MLVFFYIILVKVQTDRELHFFVDDVSIMHLRVIKETCDQYYV